MLQKRTAASVLAATQSRSTPQVALYGDSGWRASACADDRGRDEEYIQGRVEARERGTAHLGEEAARPRTVFFQGFQVPPPPSPSAPAATAAAAATAVAAAAATLLQNDVTVASQRTAQWEEVTRGSDSV